MDTCQSAACPALTHTHAPVAVALQPDAEGALWWAVARRGDVNGYVGNRDAVALPGGEAGQASWDAWIWRGT